MQLPFVDCGAHLRGFVEAIAHAKFPGAVDKLFYEVLVNTLLHNDAAGRGAALSGGAEGAPQRAFEREIEVGVVEHNHRILAAKFERAMLEALGRGGADGLSHC